MSLAAHQLEAFHAVVETGRFARAAKRLGVTQPALSQRVQALEAALGQPLFVRRPAGATLTDAGARLLRYCEAKRGLETELLADLAAPGTDLAGQVRVAAFSSVARSCVLPALAPLLRAHPRLLLELVVRETGALEGLLLRGGAELVVLDRTLDRPDVEHVVLGREELVLVEAAKEPRTDVYLDHDPEDATTLTFLARNGVKTRFVRRSFVGDIYGVIDAASAGLGRAVVPRHLLDARARRQLRIVPGMRASPAPVVLHHVRQPAHPRAHEAVRQALVTGVPERLRS